MENEKKFAQKLKDTPKIKDGTTRLNGKQERAWLGVNFKVLTDNDLEASESKEPTQLKLVTDVTDVTGDILCQNLQEASNNIEESKTPVTSVTSVTEQTLTFIKINPNVDPHKCDSCQAVLAEYKQPLDAEQQQLKNKDAIYACPTCFKEAKIAAATQGVKFIDVTPMSDFSDKCEPQEGA
jgi:hypothetical protein